MKQALVVGSNSMLGQELAVLLATFGASVIRCGRTGRVDVKYDLASLDQPPTVPAGPVDVIFFCASSFADNSWDGCLANALVNAVAPYRIAQWAAQLHCPHVVMAGSVSSCPGFKPSSYGLTKAHGEEAMQFACGLIGAQFTAIRFPQLCDDRGLCARHQVWFARIIARAAAGEDLRLPAGDVARNFLHVHDAARALVSVWQTGVTGNHALVAPESHTYRAIAETAYQVFARGGTVVDAPEMKPFQPVTFPPASPAVAALIAEGRIPMRDAIARIHARGTAAAFAA